MDLRLVWTFLCTYLILHMYLYFQFLSLVELILIFRFNSKGIDT